MEEIIALLAAVLGAGPTRLGEARQDALAAAGRDAAQLLHVQVEELPWSGVLIADDLAGRAVESGQPMEASPAQDGVDGGVGTAQEPGDAVGPQLRSWRAWRRAAVTAGSVWRGLVWGRLERPWRSASPSAWERRTYLMTVARETRKRRATSAWGQPAWTWATNSRRVAGVNVRQHGP